METTATMPQPADKKRENKPADGRIARGEATRDRVLDAAERCFSAHGFAAVTIRQIAREASVTLGVVSFHGGSKEALFQTVLARRVDTLNRLRRDALARLRQSGDLTLEKLIDAYLTPYLEIASRGDPQWRAYAQLIARIATNDDRYYPRVGDIYDPVAHEYLEAMHEVRPEADREILATSLVLTVASMLTIVASRTRIERLSGARPADNALAYRKVLIDFCTGGIERALG